MRRAYSNEIPKLQRLQGVILYPLDVVQTADELGNEIYQYEELVIEDTGQDISDPAVFEKENWAMLRTAAYAAREVSVKQDGMWESFKASIEEKITSQAIAPK